jgi:hypothetical protein
MINRNSKRELGKKRGLASAKAWTPCEADADTLRSRSLYDARGRVVREGCDYSSHGEANWQVRRSTEGKTNQQDLLSNGQPFVTGGPRIIAQWLASFTA